LSDAAPLPLELDGLTLGGGGGLASIPVFDASGIMNDDGGYHYQWFHFAVRERMRQANGGSPNHVMWRGNPVPPGPAWASFSRWLDAVAADRSGAPLRVKVVRDRPPQLVDGCWTSPTDFVAEPQTFGRDPDSTCNAAFPSFAFPRHVAGGPLAANKLKCRLKPIDPADHAFPFSPEEQARLAAIFPPGARRPGRRATPASPGGRAPAP
jgi:hypothetical protein